MSGDDYLRGFHDRRAGITDEVLRRCRSADGLDPYAWLLSATPTKGRMLDVACGNAPISRYISHEYTYAGVDGSVAELAVAGRPGPLIQADAAALPFDSGGFDVAVCSMALMVITPLPVAVAEIRRVLRPGGRLVATIPDTGPLRPFEVPVIVGLLAALGSRLTYPNDSGAIAVAVRNAGLRPAGRERRRFAYKIADDAAADRFLDSLYLPGLTHRRYRAARAYLRRLARVGVEMPVPLQRVIAVVPEQPGPKGRPGRR